ncbi:MBL fold metallo-hydrolase [Nocardia sp. AG03]|uniref:MBL fold metallo-hydrolase n=1 Tax=Nocardia sp. AG03 TaxID=3025312 RepID=UPI0024187701|nr:MBL fold metallo-hydrolase [Nocardia sp. AG03]
MTELREVADGVFAYVDQPGGWCVSNAALIRSGGESALVDTLGTERRARALRSALATLDADFPCAVINTHWHGDHTAGNALFAPAPVIAHRAGRAAMVRNGLAVRGLWTEVDWGTLPLVLPTIGVSGAATLHVGDREVELLAGDTGHSDGDLIAWLPRERVLVAGDLVMPGCTPFLLSGSLSGALTWLDRLLTLAPTVVIGGHGEVADQRALAETADYLRWLRTVTLEAAAAGATPLEAARQVDPAKHGDHPWSTWQEPERLVANLHRAYAELAPELVSTPVRSGPVLAEMAEFLGAPLTTAA